MPQADARTTTTRRELGEAILGSGLIFGSIACFLHPESLRARTQATNITSDAKLIRLCAEYADVDRQIGEHPTSRHVQTTRAQDEEGTVLHRRLSDLGRLICSLSASTRAGEQAKAQVLRLSLGFAGQPDIADEPASLTWSLLGDILRPPAPA